jgi:hypothetical protein
LRARTSLELRREDVSSDDSSDDERDEPILVGWRLAEVRSRLRGETGLGLLPVQVAHATAIDDRESVPPAARRGPGAFAGLPVRGKGLEMGQGSRSRERWELRLNGFMGFNSM